MRLISKTPKKLFTLFLGCSFCLVSMSSSFVFDALPEAEIINFRQNNGENLKKAWDRLFEDHKRIMPWIPMHILLRIFYYGVFRWCKHSLDLLAGGNFIECEETKALDIINGLSSFFVYAHGVDAIIDILDIIEKKIDASNLKEVDIPTQGGQDLLEIADDWELMGVLVTPPHWLPQVEG